MKLKIATRKSKLALWQTDHVTNRLKFHYPDLEIEWVEITTTGDKILDRPLAEVGGKALFVKELEIALLEGRADLAVHSMKDVPNELPDGFTIAAILEREDPRDAFLSEKYTALEMLPKGAVVGTSSFRRQAQVLAFRPDLKLLPLRGNLDTRLRKLKEGEYDAIILAMAGLKRLGWSSQVKEVIPPALMVPGAGQGAIGIECLSSRKDVLDKLKILEHPHSSLCLRAERAMNRELSGNCYSPIGSFAEIYENDIVLRGLVASRDGSNVIRVVSRGSLNHPEAVGINAARDLFAQGAGDLLCQA